MLSHSRRERHRPRRCTQASGPGGALRRAPTLAATTRPIASISRVGPGPGRGRGSRSRRDRRLEAHQDAEVLCGSRRSASISVVYGIAELSIATRECRPRAAAGVGSLSPARAPSGTSGPRSDHHRHREALAAREAPSDAGAERDVAAPEAAGEEREGTPTASRSPPGEGASSRIPARRARRREVGAHREPQPRP